MTSFYEKTFLDHNRSSESSGNFRPVTKPTEQPFCPWKACKVLLPGPGFWLVVLTILKHISQWEGLSRILWKIKDV